MKVISALLFGYLQTGQSSSSSTIVIIGGQIVTMCLLLVKTMTNEILSPWSEMMSQSDDIGSAE